MSDSAETFVESVVQEPVATEPLATEPVVTETVTEPVTEPVAQDKPEKPEKRSKRAKPSVAEKPTPADVDNVDVVVQEPVAVVEFLLQEPVTEIVPEPLAVTEIVDAEPIVQPTEKPEKSKRVEKPPKAVLDIVEYAVSFTSLAHLPDDKLRLRTSIADLMHTMGYYGQQVKSSHLTTAARLNLIADTLRHIAGNLGT